MECCVPCCESEKNARQLALEVALTGVVEEELIYCPIFRCNFSCQASSEKYPERALVRHLAEEHRDSLKDEVKRMEGIRGLMDHFSDGQICHKYLKMALGVIFGGAALGVLAYFAYFYVLN